MYIVLYEFICGGGHFVGTWDMHYCILFIILLRLLGELIVLSFPVWAPRSLTPRSMSAWSWRRWRKPWGAFWGARRGGASTSSRPDNCRRSSTSTENSCEYIIELSKTFNCSLLNKTSGKGRERDNVGGGQEEGEEVPSFSDLVTKHLHSIHMHIPFCTIISLICFCFYVCRAWTSEMLARVTAPELAADVAGAEQLLARHQEIRTEIDARQEDFTNFYKTGEFPWQFSLCWQYCTSPEFVRNSLLEGRPFVVQT